MLHNLYYRAGILAYLEERYDEATKLFDAAGPVRPTEGKPGKFDVRKIGVFVLMECARLKEPSWDPEAINSLKNENQRLVLRLADTYTHSRRSDKAEAIYRQLLNGNSSLGKPSKAVEGYCLMQLALAYSKTSDGRDRAIEIYTSLYRPEYAKCPWTPVAILRLGVLTFNMTQDAKKAMPHYQYVFTHYPDHPDSERALYFYCLAAFHLDDKAVGTRSVEEFLKRYPTSRWKASVESLKSGALSPPSSSPKGNRP